MLILIIIEKRLNDIDYNNSITSILANGNWTGVVYDVNN